MCGDTKCACVETRDEDGQPWCGKPDLSFAPCCRTDCPCPASWNGQEGQYCGRTCQRSGACSTDRHVTPSGAASTTNLVPRWFTVIGRVRCRGPYVYSVHWDDDPGQIFITELHPRMFIPWPRNLPCPVPSSHATRYEWTLSKTGTEDVTIPEELVELVARTHGYVVHSSITPSDGTASSAASSTYTSNAQGKVVDRGGKRASETNDHEGREGEKRISNPTSLPGVLLSTSFIAGGPIAYASKRQGVVIASTLSAEPLEPSNDPPSDTRCVICGGVDPMYGGTISCPQCSQSLCPDCFPPTQHQPCCSPPSASFEAASPNLYFETSSQYPFHIDTCTKGTGKKTVTVQELDNSMSRACRRNGITKRGTSSHRGRGSGAGGGGGGDDRRNYRKPLPEDAYEHWMEDELTRIIERILEGANARFLGNMPPYPDGSITPLWPTQSWMRWLNHLLDGHLERNCGSNYKDKGLVNALCDECVKSSTWLHVMHILELVSKAVRKVRAKNAVDFDSDPGYNPTWGD